MSLNLDPMVESARVAEGYVESDLHFMNEDRKIPSLRDKFVTITVFYLNLRFEP